MLRRFAPLIFALSLGACDIMAGLEFVRTDLVSIGVTKGSIVEVGDTVRVKASGGVSGVIGLFGNDLVPDARWSIADPTIAQVQPVPPPLQEDSLPQGQTLIRGVRPGTTMVTAAAREVSGEAAVRVIPIVNGIRLMPARDTLAVGDTISVTANAVEASGARVDGLRLTFAVGGGLQLYSWGDATARVVAIGRGPATVGARFRRAVGEVGIVVIDAQAP